MKQLNRPWFQWSLIMGIAVSGALTPLLSATAEQRNPCPRIYYEEPFNSTRLSPEGCPPNTITQRQRGDTQTQPGVPLPRSNDTLAPPLPEEQQKPSAIVTPVNGGVTVRLVNNTYTIVTHQVIGETEERRLLSRSQVTLQNLQTPITLTLVRPDGGFVRVSPRAIANGVLEVQMSEAEGLDEGTRSLQINSRGEVFRY